MVDHIRTINPASGEEIADYDPMTAQDIENILDAVTTSTEWITL